MCQRIRPRFNDEGEFKIVEKGEGEGKKKLKEGSNVEMKEVSEAINRPILTYFGSVTATFYTCPSFCAAFPQKGRSMPVGTWG